MSNPQENKSNIPEKTEYNENKKQKEDVQEKSENKEKKKFIFNCTKCGKCCEKWDEIPIYIEDLQRWLKDGSFNYVLSFLQVKELSQYSVGLVLKRPQNENEEDENPSGCPLYDYENKLCNLYSSMPIHCAAYPLGYNGEKFFLVDKDCPGLGNGSMTKEWLTTCRNRAKDQLEAQTSSTGIMSILYGLILGNIMQKSQEAMSQLSDEDRKQLDDLLAKSEKEKQSKENVEDNNTEDNNTEDNNTEDNNTEENTK